MQCELIWFFYLDAEQIRINTPFQGHEEVVFSSEIFQKWMRDGLVLMRVTFEKHDDISITDQLILLTSVQYVSSRSFLPVPEMI